MSGNRYLLDTNAVIALLQGNLDLAKLLGKANWVGISIITELEFLSFPALTLSDQKLFQKFLKRVEVIDLNQQNSALLIEVINLRRSKKLKLPDAIIAASTLEQSATLITTDIAFKKLSNLSVHSF